MTLRFPKIDFYRRHERCGLSIVIKYTFQRDNFCWCLRSVFILSCHLTFFEVFEGQLSLSIINRPSTFNFPAEN